jgi:hypothetical protein
MFDAETGTARLATVGEGLAPAMALAANRGVFARAELDVWLRPRRRKRSGILDHGTGRDEKAEQQGCGLCSLSE